MKKILIVDDEKDLRDLLKARLVVAVEKILKVSSA